MIGSAAYWAKQLGKKTVLGGMSPIDPNWLNMIFSRDLMPHFDAVGVHGFPDTFEYHWQGWDIQIKRIRDVLLSGGDALCVSDNKLEYILESIRSIEHVEIIRIGTRTPVVMPQRITPQLCRMIKKYHPVWINTHFNHPNEITKESIKACEMLVNAGIPLGNQSVLLKNVNDCPYIMKNLVQKLTRYRIRPYYIYQCDLSEGIEHFRTSVSAGIEIIEMLRGHTSGFSVPTFVVDAPGGGGKIPVNPQYLISQSPEKVILRNFEGVICTYEEPKDKTHECKGCGLCKKYVGRKKTGLEKLYQEDTLCLIPSSNIRLKRRDIETERAF